MKKLILIFLIQTSTIAFAEMDSSEPVMNSTVSERVAAKMAAPQSISLKETVGYFQAQQKVRKLSVDEIDVLKLAAVARDIFGVEELYLSGFYSNNEEKAKSVGLETVAMPIQAVIEKRSDWNEALSKGDLEKTKAVGDLIKKSLGENSFAWAWITYQKGEKQQAKVLLSRSFDQSYKAVMALTQLQSRHSNPLQSAEQIAKVLVPLSSDAEVKENEQRLQKMRLHISKLPDLQIMT